MMKSAFVFDPVGFDPAGFDPAGAKDASGKFDLVHVSCVPFLCGADLAAAEKLRASLGSSFSGKFPGNTALDVSGKSGYFREKREKREKGGPLLLLSLPFISRGKAFDLFKERFAEFADVFDGFTLQNIGDLEFLSGLLRENGFSQHDFFLAGDTAFNVFNSGTALFWRGKLDSLAILPELDPGEQKALAGRFPEGIVPEIVSCGVVPVMRSEHCFSVKGRNFKCGACGKYGLAGGSLRDVAGREFRIVTNPLDCNCVLLGSVNVRQPGEDERAVYRTAVFV